MPSIPEDLTPVLREIDNALKAEGVPPQGRAIRAVMEFGKRFGLSMPLTTAPVTPDDPLSDAMPYTQHIFAWFGALHGERGKTDFSANAKVAVLADGDLWEMRIPWVRGTIAPKATRELPEDHGNTFGTEPLFPNPCASLKGITALRLSHFSDDDLNEAYGMFVIGLDVREVFDRFRAHDPLFLEAETDWTTSAALLTAQRPNFGQSRWATLQMCEKFMKGMIKVIGEGNPNHGHKLDALHNELKKSIRGLDHSQLLSDLKCTAAVRYGEVISTREQAYAAHKSGLLLIRSLGSVRYANG